MPHLSTAPTLGVRGLAASKYLTLTVLLFLVFTLPVCAQDQLQIGFQSYGTYHVSEFDSVNVDTHNLDLRIPIVSYPQRGDLPNLNLFMYRIPFTWSTYKVVTNYNTTYYWQPAPSALNGTMQFAWDHNIFVNSSQYQVSSTAPVWYAWRLQDQSGATHILGWTDHTVGANPPTSMETVDGSGYRVVNGTIFDKNGVMFPGYTGCVSNCGPNWSMKDTKGNTVGHTDSTNTTILDSVGRKIPDPYWSNPSSPGCYTFNFPTVSGATPPTTFCYSNHTATSNFQNPNVVDQSYTLLFLDSISLPNGRSWTFTYNSWGDLSSITLPTGGTISYTWGNLTNSCLGANQQSTARVISTRTVNDGTGPSTWTYSNTIVTDPLGNDTFYTLTPTNGDCGPNLVTKAQYYNGSSTNASNLLKTVETQYAISGENPFHYIDHNFGSYSILPILTKTTWPNGQVSQTCRLYDDMNGGPCAATYNTAGPVFYDNNGNPPPSTAYPFVYGDVVQTSEYDYGSGGPGPLLRQTNTQFFYQTNSGYFTNFLGKPSSVTVLDGGGHQVAQTTYGYDENNGSPQGIYGNLTSVTRWSNVGASPKAQTVYNAQGMPSQTIDANSHSTIITYDGTGMFPQQIQYPTTANGVSHIEKFTYDTNTGLMTSHTDQNSQTTSYGYDAMHRLTGITYPDGGSETYQFNDPSLPPTFTYIKKINGNANLVKVGTVDGLGRPTQTALTSDPGGYTYTATTYDALGRVLKSYNPTRCNPPTSNCGNEPTWGFTQFKYDPLGRTTQITQPDGNIVSMTYTGRATQTQDEGNGTQRVTRISQVDGLGRLSSVCEVVPGSGSACGQDVAGSGNLTTYLYDALNNLQQVQQINSSVIGPRVFNYDSLSRLTSATNPESGTTCYGSVSGSVCQGNGYDLNGNLITKTDANGSMTTFGYDALNRLVSKAYSVNYSSYATPGVTNTYDVAVDGLAITNAVGRLVKSATSDGLTATVNSYDPMGRISNQWQCTPQNCGTGYFSLPYVYDFAGNITSAGNGLGVTIGYGPYNGANEIPTVTSNLSDANHPATLFSNAAYTPFGAIGTVQLGNGITEKRAYNTRLALTSYTATDPVGGSATPGTGSVTVSGSEKYNTVQTQAAKAGTGTVTISGSERNWYPCGGGGCPPLYDGGTLKIIVNGVTAGTATYGNPNSLTTTPPNPTPTAGSLAFLLTNSINSNSNSPVTASVFNATITLTAKTTGASTNYSLSTTVTSTFVSNGHPPASFSMSTSGSTLTGGQDAVYSTTYDTGSVSIMVNNSPASTYTYNQGDTASSVASALIQHFSSPVATASPNGSTSITITAKSTGSSTNYPVSFSNSSSNGFSPPSFCASGSSSSCNVGMSLSGGTNDTLYNLALSYEPDGDVLSSSDSANGNWTYTYDWANRVTGANQNSGQNVYSYVYDALGNRTQQNGPNTMLMSFTGNGTINNNQADGYGYDFAGNTTNDKFNLMTYDAENRVTQVANTSSTTTFIYDANGRRVRKTVAGTPVDFLYDIYGNQVAAINSSGNRSEVYAGSRHLATYTGGTTGTTYFTHSDWLGTERVRSTASGAPYETCTSLVFGDWLTCSGGDPSPMHFTGQEHDPESGFDNFTARYYSSRWGRLLSPDPGNAGASLGNPQSWNAYAYVMNNPLKYVDPNGLDCAYLNAAGTAAEEIDHSSTQAECEANGGYWANGYIGGLDWVHTNDSDVVTIDSLINGQMYWSRATQDWTQGAFAYSSFAAPDDMGGLSSTSRLWIELKTGLLTWPSTGPGSCLDVALQAAKAPLDQLKTAAQNTSKYVAPIAPLLPGAAAQIGDMDPNSMYTFEENSDGETVRAVLSVNAVVATTATAVAGALSEAVEAVPYAIGVGADAIGLYAVIQEKQAAAKGQCVP